jgi:hypothetical protein
MSIASLYPSINPSLLLDFANSKVLDSRVTFTRTTTATYYDGVTTAKAEENLLTYSQEFDNAAWSKALVTITSNATTAPDGTSTADLAVANTTNGDHSVVQSFTFPADTTLTISCYMKAAGYDYGVIRHYSAGNGDVWASFNLSTGAVDSNSSGVTASITSVGSSWYRCVMTKTYSSATSGNSYGIRVANAGGIGTPFAGNGTSGIYIWGAQLEQRSSATAYTATTTQAITNYIPVLQTAASGVARFDHNPTTGESLGLLIEEQRTNISLYSSYSAANWAQNSASVTANSVVAPDGTLSAATLIEDTSANYHITYPPGVINAAATYTASVYLKQAGRRYAAVQIYIDNAASRYTILVDLSNGSFVASNNVGTPTSTSYAITSVGNGWYRVSVTAAQTSNNVVGIVISASNSATPSYLTGLPTYTGNGWNSIYFWGAQIEAGAFATSYIPTVASSVTRNADAASMTGTNFSSWFNNANMSAYIEAATNAPPASTNTTGFSLNDGTLNRTNFFQSGGGSLSSARAWLFAYNNGATIVSLNSAATAVTQSVMAKSCVAIKTNDFGFSLNSGAVLTDTDGTPVVPTQMNIGADYNASAYLNGTIKKLAYYPIRVTNAQLQALTV